MGRHTEKPTFFNRTVVVSAAYLADVERYFKRFLELQKLYYQMLDELPLDRQFYYAERSRGIDTRIREAHNGTQDHPNRTT